MGSLLVKLLGEGVKLLLPTLLPKLQPLLEGALKDLIKNIFDNIGKKNPTAGGVLGLSSGAPNADVDNAVSEEVSKFMLS